MKRIISISLILLIFLSQGLDLPIYADINLSGDPLFQKGMCFVTWTKDKYMSQISDESLLKMKAVGVEWVAIVVTWYQEKFDSKKIFPQDNSPSDRSVEYVINKAHEIGLKVMLKPHLDLINQEDTLWRGDIGFGTDSDWEEWFGEYNKFILHYAEMAQKTGVEILCIGTELTFAATEKPDIWRNKIIPSVRAAYSGPITYAANWQGEYADIGFWDALDYAGLDAYFPLSREEKPTFWEIKRAWESWCVKIGEWQKKINKPVIFTEVGYCSAEGAAKRPWEVAMKGEVDLGIQSDCYRALLETVWDKPWFYGVYWWQWNTNASSGGKANRRFTPQNKPAQNILAMWYKYRNIEQRKNSLENVELVRYTY